MSICQAKRQKAILASRIRLESFNAMVYHKDGSLKSAAQHGLVQAQKTLLRSLTTATSAQDTLLGHVLKQRNLTNAARTAYHCDTF